MPKDDLANPVIRTYRKRVILTTRDVSLLAFITLLGSNTALASDAVIHMSQVQDYTPYRMDL